MAAKAAPTSIRAENPTLKWMRFAKALCPNCTSQHQPNTGIPVGDIGVGGREIGYIRQYKRLLTNRWEGVPDR
jgi:glutamate dehydrogenase/leucine dehydrogenase